MINRRRTPRATANNAAGLLRLLDDVEIEQVTDKAITVLAETQVPRGERMILWAPTDDGGESPLQVRAVQRQIDLTSASLRHRVRFDLDSPAAPVGGAGPVARRAGAAGRRIGGIVREVPIKLLDLSAVGCLIESPVRIAEGLVGVLSVSSPHAQHQEIVRVCRSERRSDRFWPWMAGVEFLTLEAPSAVALRRNISLFTNAHLEAHERT